MNEIMYKSKFTGWRKINSEIAFNWAKYMLNAITTGKSNQDRINIINSRLDGIKFNEEDLI